MRNLLRNQRRVWYCPYSGRTAITDPDGHDTGETAVAYGEPVAAMANVSAASGDATQEMFGIGVSYDKVLQLPGTGWPIDERTVLYVDREPPGEFVATGVEADYAVVRVSTSLNQTSVAVRKVRD